MDCIPLNKKIIYAVEMNAYSEWSLDTIDNVTHQTCRELRNHTIWHITSVTYLDPTQH